MDIEPTTRAYTLKLKGAGDWRRQLWLTHLAVNRGAWTWGDWLLTLRGGLPASLADGHPERRLLLALSWLSVESPATLIRSDIVVAANADDRDERIMAAFRKILADQGVSDVQEWEAACSSALTARLRDDAVWVNRFAAFGKLREAYSGLDSDWASETLFDFLGGEEAYFTMPSDEDGKTPEAKDFVQKAGGWLSKYWGSGAKSDASAIGDTLRALADVAPSKIVGKSGTEAIRSLLFSMAPHLREAKLQDVFKTLKQSVGWKGRPSKGSMALEKLAQAKQVDDELWSQTRKKLIEEAESQVSKASKGDSKPHWMDAWRKSMESPQGIGVPYRTNRDLIWEHGVMLDHALRRVSSAQSWIKRAEVERQKCEHDAGKPVDPEARKRLDAFCEQRAEETVGGVSDYVIRKAALDCWEKIADSWQSCEEMSDENKRDLAASIPEERSDGSTRSLDERARVAAARDVQSNLGDDEKIGDMTLFERLAVDDAVCVWRDANGKADPKILRNYSDATVAEFNRRRFKVPAYRHPDPLRNPIYVDFGNSRWGIAYSALEEAQKRPALRQKLAKAKTESTRAKLRAELSEQPDLRGVKLGLWTGESLEHLPLRWQGKRLWKDLDLDNFDLPAAKTVVRADRLGRAAKGTPSGAVSVAEVFAAKDWNGRLQVPRKQLDRLADLVYGKERIERNGNTTVIRNGADYAKLGNLLTVGTASKAFRRLNWFLTTSAKLKPSGPIWDFVREPLPAGVGFKKGRTGWYFDYAKNKDRRGRARLLLAEIPGLRILSYDMGVRHAAACAVWETLSQRSLDHETKERKVLGGGTGSNDLYLHTEHRGSDGKPRRTIYRRTAADTWARLDRQFFVKLQGEDRVARKAHPDEQQGLGKFLELLGLPVSDEAWRIDDLQAEAVKLARQGLRRLGDVARIAYAMTAKNKPISGGRTSPDFSPEERITYIQDALWYWQRLVGGAVQNGEHEESWARRRWQEFVVDRLGGPQPTGEFEQDLDFLSPKAISKNRQEKTASLLPLRGVAEQLADAGSPLAGQLHRLWSDRFRELEAEWKKQLRWLRRLILPVRSSIGEDKRRIRNVGGLSVKRLQTIRGLYETMRAFRMRPEPDDLRKNIPTLGDEGLANFGRRILDRLELLREQRIKQLASRVVEGALGAGRTPKPCGRDRKRPTTLVDAPCHAVVAEDLVHYKPEESRLRRENRRLMDWAARNVRKYVVEGCQLNGLHFVEVSPAYTSKQDSRTGAPGIRCEDIPAEVLAAAADPANERPKTARLRRQARWLAGDVSKAKSATGESKPNPRHRVLLAAIKRLEGSPNSTRPVRLPRRGGELFVSANPDSPAAKGLQADLNAAANIGLKALMHPDFIGSWWYVLVNRATGRPESEKAKGSTLPLFADDAEPLLQPDVDSEVEREGHGAMKSGKPRKKKAASKKKASVYAWNPTHAGAVDGRWLNTESHQEAVERQVAESLIAQQNQVQTPW